jgi:hypothetical protein
MNTAFAPRLAALIAALVDEVTLRVLSGEHLVINCNQRNVRVAIRKELLSAITRLGAIPTWSEHHSCLKAKHGSVFILCNLSYLWGMNLHPADRTYTAPEETELEALNRLAHKYTRTSTATPGHPHPQYPTPMKTEVNRTPPATEHEGADHD